MAQEVVIFLPGIMGSELWDGNDLIWPGQVSELFLPYSRMAQLLKDDLQCRDIIRSVSLSSQYEALVRSLNSCGFRETDDPPTLYVCPYDWRKDNAVAADRLATLVDVAVQAHGSKVGLTLIAHSMGGLVARCYLESGQYDARPGQPAVRRLITLATPHRGAPLALQAALGQVRRLWLNADQVKTVANDSRFPSLYQLLPPMGEPFAWEQSGTGRYAPVDIYNEPLRTQLKLGETNLAAAQRFHGQLNLGKRPKGVDYFFFAGTRQRTTSEIRIRTQGTIQVYAEEREDAGDGTVPIWSGSQSGVQMAPVGGEHGDIYKNPDLKRILAVLLGRPGALAEAAEVELALRDPVLATAGQTRALLGFPQSVVRIDGVLRMVRLLDSQGRATPAAQPVAQAVTYAGAAIDRLSLVVTAPGIPGLYRVSFATTSTGAALAEDDLFVQSP